MALLLNAGDTVSRSYSYTQPSPLHPSQPQGTGERTGNLWSFYPERTTAGVTLSWDGEKVSYSGTCTSSQNLTVDIELKAGTYTLKANANRIPIDDTTSCIDIYRASPFFMVKIENSNAVEGSKTFTIDEDTKVTLRIRIANGVNYDGFEIRPMLNTGSTPLPYEPYGYKIPISSANTTTPVYMGEVETTRKIKKYECTGEEHWQFYSDSVGTYGAWQFYANNIATGLALSSAQSNIANYGVTATTRHLNPYGVYLVTSGTGVAFQMAGAKDTFPTVTAWKSYLAAQYAAGTPVTVWYVLATEETAVVNEPLMKIGDYADSLTTSIPCTAGENTLDVQTTVAPSEVTATFEGWHPVSAAHERSGGAWD